MTGAGQQTLGEYLAARRAEVDEALGRLLPGPPDCPAVIADAMRYSVLAGGKRLRPILCLTAAEAVSAHPSATPVPDPVAAALPAACAIEWIHTYSLIHDDLPAMDDDTLRRGRPTLHVVFGEGTAILAGDGLLAEAFALMARLPADEGNPTLAARKLRVIETVAVAAGATGMVGGQTMDLQGAAQGDVEAAGSEAQWLRTLHARKTGALIRAASVSGAILGGGSDALIAAIDRYAAELGLAFQIVDDILDVEGAAAELGKTAGKDAAAGKLTYPALYGLGESRRLAAQSIERAIAALDEARFPHGRLAEIARYVVERRH